jgi:UDP-N-acetylmuramoyl-L-alanyl-D-glutamate--2,6-diaminopimelate ligase
LLAQVTPESPRPINAEPRALAELARAFDLQSVGQTSGVYVTGVTVNTYDVHDGDLFVGLAGANRHGAEFAEAARAKGAAAVLTDGEGAKLIGAIDVPIVVADDPRALLGEVSAWLYGTATDTPQLFAVTGTNGKTSTVHFLEAILRQMGLTTGLSSTAERHIGDLSVVSGLTTPEASELHALIARMKEAGVQAAALEVSAQALSRHRVDGAIFDVAGFTNLSHDHLDDYGDMQSYFDAKLPLFQPDRSRRGVVSLESPWAAQLRERAGVPVVTISSDKGQDADWHVEIDEEGPDGVAFTVTSPRGESIATSVPVIGKHMAANAGLAIAMIVEGGHDESTVAAAIGGDGGIDVYLPGRAERVSSERGPAVFVDFGHSPEAFAATLYAVRQVTEGNVIMVFGADGDRDATKRPSMSRAAVEGSDILVITDHHPRFEDPASIRAELMEAARAADPSHVTVEVADPKKAIREAVRLAKEGDSILWAGPGHQNYRDIEGVHVEYSARAEARAALREAGWAPEDPSD